MCNKPNNSLLICKAIPEKDLEKRSSGVKGVFNPSSVFCSTLHVYPSKCIQLHVFQAHEPLVCGEKNNRSIIKKIQRGMGTELHKDKRIKYAGLCNGLGTAIPRFISLEKYVRVIIGKLKSKINPLISLNLFVL